MGQMVKHWDELLIPTASRKVLFKEFFLQFGRVDFFVLSATVFFLTEERFEWFIRKAMSHEVDLLRLQLARFETVSNGIDRESARRFFSSESFFGGGSEDFAVSHQCGGGIETLSDAVIPAGQVWELFLLELDAVLKPTNTYYVHEGLREFSCSFLWSIQNKAVGGSNETRRPLQPCFRNGGAVPIN